MSIAVLSVFSVLSNYVRDKRDKCNSRIEVAKQQGSVMWSVIHGCHESATDCHGRRAARAYTLAVANQVPPSWSSRWADQDPTNQVCRICRYSRAVGKT